MSDIFVSNESNVNVSAESMLNASDMWQEQQEILRELAQEAIAREQGFWFFMDSCGFSFEDARQMEIDNINTQIFALQVRLMEIVGEQ